MSRINGEKARASITRKRRNAQRVKDTAARTAAKASAATSTRTAQKDTPKNEE